MSKRVTLTNIEIQFIKDMITEFMEISEGERTAFTDEGVGVLVLKLSREPVTKPLGLLKVHHD